MFVLPLYEVLLVPGVNMYVRGEEFEEFALSKAMLHEDVVLLTAKEQKPRYAYTADDFYEIGVGGYVSDVSQDGFVTIRANERLRIDAVRVNDDATIEVETTGLIDVRDVPEEERLTRLRAIKDALNDFCQGIRLGQAGDADDRGLPFDRGSGGLAVAMAGCGQ